MFVSLPFAFLVLAAQLSASISGTGPSASRASLASRTTVVDGRLLDKYRLLPVSGFCNEDRRNECKKAVLKEALDSLLIEPLANMVTEYGKSCSRQFAEELYAELWAGKTDLLYGELYDAENAVLKEPHDFWEHLSGAAQPVVAFVHMLWEARKKHPGLEAGLKGFAELVSARVPQTAYFVGCYLDSNVSFPLSNASLDEWPQALLNDQDYLASLKQTDYDAVARACYFLAQGNVERLRKHLCRTLSSEYFAYVFRALCAVEPALLRRLFEVGFAKDSSTDKELFQAAAPVAMGIDPTLSDTLIAIARKNSWAEPVAEESVQTELADDGEAGGTLHMQPLMPVAQNLENTAHGSRLAASSTCKTISAAHGFQLHVAAGNELCARSNWNGCYRCYLHIRSFETDTVSTHELAPGHPVKVGVQHGDVIFIVMSNVYPPFLKAHAYCTGLSGQERFERVKAFCHAAKSFSDSFLAIIESDKLQEQDARRNSAKRKNESSGGEERGSKRTRKGRGSSKRKQERGKDADGSVDDLQESQVRNKD